MLVIVNLITMNSPENLICWSTTVGKGTLILTSLLEDLYSVGHSEHHICHLENSFVNSLFRGADGLQLHTCIRVNAGSHEPLGNASLLSSEWT